ncbi:uncharacterized protein LTR77_009078 [Saxophila tyrrhenica]|uniref:Uncharacterized protein n=1 Tax=Saxophila tyrrhenica TaxID=1690608 RepID=A0AAV9P009_9PEZI|nr:hypothetical protein LTR77_009078 [Saxophila tyrrhenica]
MSRPSENASKLQTTTSPIRPYHASSVAERCWLELESLRHKANRLTKESQEETIRVLKAFRIDVDTLKKNQEDEAPKKIHQRLLMSFYGSGEEVADDSDDGMDDEEGQVLRDMGFRTDSSSDSDSDAEENEGGVEGGGGKEEGDGEKDNDRDAAAAAGINKMDVDDHDGKKLAGTDNPRPAIAHNKEEAVQPGSMALRPKSATSPRKAT